MESSVCPMRSWTRPFAARRVATWPGVRNSLPKWTSSPLSVLSTISPSLLMVSALSLSGIPVRVSLWFTHIEKEERESYLRSPPFSTIFSRELLLWLASLITSAMKGRPSFSDTSESKATHISPPASLRIHLTSSGVTAFAGMVKSVSASRPSRSKRRIILPFWRALMALCMFSLYPLVSELIISPKYHSHFCGAITVILTSSPSLSPSFSRSFTGAIISSRSSG